MDGMYSTGYISKEEVAQKAHKLKVGDRVIITSDGKEVKATVIRFYKNLVQFKADSGVTFCEDYLSASKARIIKASDFEVASDKMNWGAILDALADENINE